MVRRRPRLVREAVRRHMARARRDRPVFTAALVWSLFVFVALVYGSRLTQKFDVAFINFGCFLGTFVILWWTRRAADVG
jgi:hypothetical protein